MSSFTPGPWSVFDPKNENCTYGIDSNDGDAVVYYGFNQEEGIPSLDDARLISKAPDMLAILKRCLSALEETGEWDTLIDNVKCLIQEAEGK